ncbi:acyl-CoA dehydrogenase domain-containing protein, partial [Spongiibacter sp.]
FSAAQQALNALYANFPVPGLGPVLKRLFFPFGDAAKAPDDQQIRQLGELIMQPQAVRELLADKVYVSHNADESVGRVLETYRHLLDIEPLYERFLKAESRLSGTNRDARVTAAVAEGLITEEEAAVLRDYEAMRYDCMLTDAFDHSLQNLDLRPLRP